jgi:hypothetical protein
MEFLLTADPDADSEPDVYEVMTNRVSLAKGVRGRHVQVGIRNVGGAAISQDNINLTVIPTTRSR